MSLVAVCDVCEKEFDANGYLGWMIHVSIPSETDPAELDVCSPDCLRVLGITLVGRSTPDEEPVDAPEPEKGNLHPVDATGPFLGEYEGEVRVR